MWLRKLNLALCVTLLSALAAIAGEKSENFDRDPGWDGHNNRPTALPRTVRQDFGFSPTSHAGGKPGEIGGHISPAGEPAFYGTVIPQATFKDKLSASGTLACPDGQFHLLLGFFNSDTVNEWRTPNTIALRLNGRGDNFLAYLEFLTAKWRIAATDGHGFRNVKIPKEGEPDVIGFPSGGAVHRWSLEWDPAADGGKGRITATIGDLTATCTPDPAYLADGATFNRFGLLNVIKSADTGGEIYLDDVTVNGEKESFDRDPNWDGRNNRNTYTTQIVRPRWDAGWSATNLAGGKAAGEIGGVLFRGDCRYPDRLAYYGARTQPMNLEKPLRASGKIALHSGASDSTVLFGFFHSRHSVKVTDSQKSGSPASFLGFAVEGPSAEGFFLYPCYRANGHTEGAAARAVPPIYILPDGKSHDWTLDYDPAGAGGYGTIRLTMDGQSVELDLRDSARTEGAEFDRLGFVSTWIDGNPQRVYIDDLTYTVSQ